MEPQGILLQDPWHLQGGVSRPTSSRRAVPLESGPNRQHPEVPPPPPDPTPAGRRVDPLVGHQDALALVLVAMRAAVAVVEPPSRPSHVPGRSADLEWRDRAIRAEALLDRLQAENLELRERIDALEAVKTKLEEEIVPFMVKPAWFQAQQQMGYLSGYYHSPRSTPQGTPRGHVGSTRRGRSHSTGRSDGGYISRSSTPARSRSDRLEGRMGKKGARSSTPGRASADTAADRTDHADGYNTMASIGEEENNVVPGIDSDPDDAIPWGANLTFPDMMDLARAIKKEVTEAGNELREKDGWRGPIGLGGGNQRNLLHNVRFWWRPKGGDRPARFRYDYSLDQWLKTVLLFKRGEITILLRDAPMTVACPTTAEDAENQGREQVLDTGSTLLNG